MGGSDRGPLRGFIFRRRLPRVLPTRRYSDPPVLGRFVDFSFGDPEVVVQPPVSGVVRLEPYRGDDRAVDGRSLLNDAVSFDGDEDLRALGGGNRPVQVRTPDEIFAAPRMIRPVHRSADPRTDDVALPGPEPGVLGLAVRGQPRPLAILHSQRAKFLEPHRAPPSGDIEGRLFGRSGRGLLRHLRSRANHSPAGGFGGLSSRTEALRLRRLQSSARTTAERIPRTPMLGAPRYGPVMLKGFVSTWSEAVFVTEFPTASTAFTSTTWAPSDRKKAALELMPNNWNGPPAKLNSY